MKSRSQLLDEATKRVVAKWPSVEADKERETMDKTMSDFQIATAYLPDDADDIFYEDAARIYDGAPRLDSEDLKSLA